ncbi:hypothetical protein HKX48_007652, partial [Thoreauomyces humboldtii]
TPHPLLRLLSDHNTHLDLFEIDQLLRERRAVAKGSRGEMEDRRRRMTRRRSVSEGGDAGTPRAPLGWGGWFAGILLWGISTGDTRTITTTTTTTTESSSSPPAEDDDAATQEFVIDWDRRRVVRVEDLSSGGEGEGGGDGAVRPSDSGGNQDVGTAQLRRLQEAAEDYWNAEGRVPPPLSVSRDASSHDVYVDLIGGQTTDEDTEDEEQQTLPAPSSSMPVRDPGAVAQFAAVQRAAGEVAALRGGRPPPPDPGFERLTYTRHWSGRQSYAQLVKSVFASTTTSRAGDRRIVEGREGGGKPEEEEKEMNVL